MVYHTTIRPSSAHFSIPSSMARQSQQGQALRVLASSQPCSLSLSMLHLQVAKAKRLQPPAGLRF